MPEKLGSALVQIMDHHNVIINAHTHYEMRGGSPFVRAVTYIHLILNIGHLRDHGSNFQMGISTSSL